MALPRTHPHCVRIESITRQILDALQRETGTCHTLTDQQGLKDCDAGEIQGRRKENEKSATTHLKEGMDWEFYVAKDPRFGADAELAIVIAHEVHIPIVHEHEADLFGIILCAYAGYDPRLAPMAVEKMKIYLPLVTENAVAVCLSEIVGRIEFMTMPEVMQPVVRLYQERMEGQSTH
ncbi:hypothetical protein AgCh_027632 [Apium graveolens]